MPLLFEKTKHFLIYLGIKEKDGRGEFKYEIYDIL
jgi:hypothetical protein